MIKQVSLGLLLLLVFSPVHAQQDIANVTQIHLRLKKQFHTPKTPLTPDELTKLAATAGVALTPIVTTTDNAQIVGLPRLMTRTEAWAIATKLSVRPEVESVAPIDPEFNKRPPNKPAYRHDISLGVGQGVIK